MGIWRSSTAPAEEQPALADVPGAKAVRVAADLLTEVSHLRVENERLAACLREVHRVAAEAMRHERYGPNAMLDVIGATGLVPPAKCPDPAGHARLYAQSERSWRLSAAQRAGEAEIGCPWCGGEAR